MLVFRRFRFIGVALALLLIASACGGGEDGADSPATTTTAPSAGGTDGAAATTTTTMKPVSGDSGSTFCERVREAAASNESPLDFDFFSLSPEEIEAQFSARLAVLEQWRDLAPSEIKDDADLVFDAYRTFVDRGNELNWDLEAMADDEVFNDDFDDAALDTASENLENYTLEVCGVDLNADADGPGLPPAGGDEDDPITAVLEAFQLPADLFSAEDIQCMRDELGAEFEAKIDADWTPSTDDIALILAAVDACGITLG